MGDAGAIENTLGGGGFTRVDVGNDAYITDLQWI
jgi:hypothetical protein